MFVLKQKGLEVIVEMGRNVIISEAPKKRLLEKYKHI